MVNLEAIVEFCNEYLKIGEISDYPNALNGLQVENNGKVSKIGMAVDGGVETIRLAVKENVDLLLIHHGLLWGGNQPLTAHFYNKCKLLFDNNIAVYGAHLPLDAHPKIGNNALLAKMLGVKVEHFDFEFQGTQIGVVTNYDKQRSALKSQLKKLFPQTIAIEYGSQKPKKIGIVSGGGGGAVTQLRKKGIDTLVTGELSQGHYICAQDQGLNLYACGHYATEMCGIQALGETLSKKFKIPSAFLPSDCPL